MITERTGDIFEQTDLNAIAHQTNTFGVFGAGIAKRIAELYPEALIESKATCKKYREGALGRFDFVETEDDMIVLNVYSQKGMGGNERNTRYDVLADVLPEVLNLLEPEAPGNFKVGIPYGFGCGLAKGSWIIVEGIFRSVFEESPTIELVIVKNPKFAASVTK